MEKLKDLWIDDGTRIPDVERLRRIWSNQIIIGNKVDELVAVQNNKNE